MRNKAAAWTLTIALIGVAVAAFAVPPAPRKPRPAAPAAHTPPPAHTPPVVAEPPVATPAPSPNAGAHTWALLVGLSDYQSGMITKLTCPALDVQAIADALMDPTLGNVPRDHVKVLTNSDATCEAIKGAVDSFLRPGVKSGDTVIIFLAGHGIAKGFGAQSKGFFLPYDVRGLTTTALEASAVNLGEFTKSLATLPAAQFISFVDACREDPTPGRAISPNDMSDVVQSSTQVIPRDAKAAAVTFYACSVGQRAYEDPNLKHGVFTYWILDGIKNAAIPAKPNGAIDMGLLGTYVRQKVGEWSKTASQGGDFDFSQTPQLVSNSLLDNAVTLMDVRRPYPDTPLSAGRPELIVTTYPAGAQVMVDHNLMGAGTVVVPLDIAGLHTVDAQLAGYDPAQQQIKAFGGYQQIITVSLPPGSRGLTAANDPNMPTAPAIYQKAFDAETRGEPDVAMVGYQASIQQAPAFQPAYEHLADLERRDGHVGAAVSALAALCDLGGPTAHQLSLLSYAYSLYGIQGPGSDDANVKIPAGGKYGMPSSQDAAASMALKAANDAIQADPSSGEGQRSLGFAYVAVDTNALNRKKKIAFKSDAQRAFSMAVLNDDKDATNHYGMGYGLRFYAQTLSNEDQRKSDLNKAINELKLAVNLRPNYYQAHREMAYCYHLLDDTDNAMKEYQVAEANRGSATDADELASVDCALGVLNKQKAQTASGDKKQAYMTASSGYWSDAKELSPDLKKAMGYLRQAGLSTRVKDYLPSQLQDLMDNPLGAITNHIGLPGGFHF